MGLLFWPSYIQWPGRAMNHSLVHRNAPLHKRESKCEMGGMAFGWSGCRSQAILRYDRMDGVFYSSPILLFHFFHAKNAIAIAFPPQTVLYQQTYAQSVNVTALLFSLIIWRVETMLLMISFFFSSFICVGSLLSSPREPKGAIGCDAWFWCRHD